MTQKSKFFFLENVGVFTEHFIIEKIVFIKDIKEI